MSEELGSSTRPLRVAIIGSGPSGFYAAEALFKSEHKVIVNMFDRLPAPFGLVRYGVAPDHQKIKNVIKVYEKTAQREGFSFFGNVELGKDINLHQLRKFHDAVIFANGAQSDRKLGVQGEDLPGSHTATDFVAWYNGHPDFKDLKFDFSGEVAVIIGQGNVAVDVCRILCKTVDELKQTDIAQYALDALAESQIKHIHMIGRRGPAQSAFTPVEIREFGELADCDPIVDPADLELNEASAKELEDPKNAQKKKNYDILKEFSQRSPSGKSKKFYVQFYKSPAALGGDGKLEKVFIEKNELVGEPGKQKSKGTGQKITLPCNLLFRSVGYKGVPIPSVPFRDDWGIIPNTEGRVEDSEHHFTGLYCTGWIKRGPSGIVGTNKPCAEETVKHLLSDIPQLIPGKNPDNAMLIDLLHELNVRFVTFEDWKRIDAREIASGQQKGKVREKFVDVEDMLKTVGK
ncbi:MAG: FAD-dependent oxidoreductase [Candidatus Omnitrophica bacterium]|nr:FAD-dependent oxidoreductase [Candidatus Omnitrophota bacterium]